MVLGPFGEAAMAAKKKARRTPGRKSLKKSRGGAAVLPEVDDQVLVAFAQGDARKPVVLGSLWNKDSPPESRT